ncbi:MAG: hypothetical protein E6J34_00045 [Chloroflexi bacterium]|nr:MAG: hypothetical protein E6J34_00045 [Chloroflexota bacterium]
MQPTQLPPHHLHVTPDLAGHSSPAAEAGDDTRAITQAERAKAEPTPTEHAYQCPQAGAHHLH